MRSNWKSTRRNCRVWFCFLCAFWIIFFYLVTDQLFWLFLFSKLIFFLFGTSDPSSKSHTSRTHPDGPARLSGKTRRRTVRRSSNELGPGPFSPPPMLLILTSAITGWRVWSDVALHITSPYSPKTLRHIITSSNEQTSRYRYSALLRRKSQPSSSSSERTNTSRWLTEGRGIFGLFSNKASMFYFQIWIQSGWRTRSCIVQKVMIYTSWKICTKNTCTSSLLIGWKSTWGSCTLAPPTAHSKLSGNGTICLPNIRKHPTRISLMHF